MKNSNMIKSTIYFNNKCEALFRIKTPNHPAIHHIAFMVIGAVLETQMNTFFILPLLMFTLTSTFMVNNEFKIRVIGQCLLFENEETGPLPKDIIFDNCKESVLGEGFLYYKTIMTMKYIMHFVLIYYATIGLSI